jgi:aspartyl-tRNA(Asn)/glutamyl-tRNA(Gln) amidotransferase subunit B
MNYTVIIGLEVHVQLQTNTKIFCGCSTRFNPENPNVQTCPVCLALPGALPVMNRRAFELAMKTALALNCNIARFTKWDRKQYYYPDLPKGYQISQYDLPFSYDGWVEIDLDPETGEKRRVGIVRAHLEEDAGKNMHDESGRGTDSQVDLNRAGTPLLEIVSQPDLRSAREAALYLEELRLLLVYLGVSDCNMQEGSLRCDANINLHMHPEPGQKIPTPIVEIKNLNSFRNVELAIEHEVKRQLADVVATGRAMGDAPKTTRGWDADRGSTYPLRSKEEAADYRYFPDPDLVPVTVTDAEVEAVRDSIGETPKARRSRYATTWGLSDYDCRVIVDQEREFADYFEAVAVGCGDGKQAANWATQDILREMKERKLTIGEFPVRADALTDLLKRVLAKQITIKSAREVFLDLLGGALAETPVPASVDRVAGIIREKGLEIVQDTGALLAAINEVIGKNAKIVADYKSGKQAAAGALIGQVMKLVKGADATVVRQLILKQLDAG